MDRHTYFSTKIIFTTNFVAFTYLTYSPYGNKQGYTMCSFWEFQFCYLQFLAKLIGELYFHVAYKRVLSNFLTQLTAKTRHDMNFQLWNELVFHDERWARPALWIAECPKAGPNVFQCSQWPTSSPREPAHSHLSNRENLSLHFGERKNNIFTVSEAMCVWCDEWDPCDSWC